MMKYNSITNHLTTVSRQPSTTSTTSTTLTRLTTVTATLLLLLLWTLPLQAETTKTDAGTTLADYLQLAAENNPEVHAAYERWQAARQQIPQMRALPDPVFTFSYFIQSVETRVGPQKGQIGVMQRFPWFGKLKLKGEAAGAEADAEKQQYLNAKLSLFYKVKTIYYQYYLTHRTIGLLEENIRLLQGLENVLLSKYRAGTAQYASLLKIQMEIEKLKDRQVSTEKMLVPMGSQLNALLNRTLSHPIPAPETLPAQMPELNHALLTEQLKANNPMLKAANHMVDKGVFNIKLAKKSVYPDIGLGLNYVITAQSTMPDVMDSGKDPIAAMMTVSLPIWSKKNKAGVNAARAMHKAAEYNRELTQNTLPAQLDMIVYQYEDAGRKLKLYKESLIPRAQQTLEVTRSGFEAGNGDYLDLIDAQRTLLALELEYEEARTRQAQRLAELEMMVGKENAGENK